MSDRYLTIRVTMPDGVAFDDFCDFCNLHLWPQWEVELVDDPIAKLDACGHDYIVSRSGDGYMVEIRDDLAQVATPAIGKGATLREAVQEAFKWVDLPPLPDR